jgi:hypothetical protein
MMIESCTRLKGLNENALPGGGKRTMKEGKERAGRTATTRERCRKAEAGLEQVCEGEMGWMRWGQEVRSTLAPLG